MSFTSGGRDVRLVVGAKSISWLGDDVAMIALMLQLQADGRGAMAVAALLIANALPIVLLSGIVGRVVDRYDNRALLIGSSLAQAVLCVLLAFVTAPMAVLALVALLGAGQAINSATWTALLPAIVEADELPKAVGLSQAATTLAGIFAPALGGLLAGLYGVRVPLLVDAASFLAVLAAAVLLHARRTVTAPAAGQKQRGGLSIVRGDNLLRPLFVLLALFVLIGSMVNVVEVFLVRQTLHASTTWYGIAGASFAVGMLAGALAGGRIAGVRDLARGFVGSAVVLSVGLAGLALVPAIGWVLPVAFVTGAGNGVLNVTLASMVMGRTQPGERGRVGALLGGVANGTQLVAFAAGGVLAAHLSPRTVFALAGGLGLLAPALLGHRVVRAAGAGDPADSADMSTPTPAAA